MSTNLVNDLLNDFRGDALNQVASALGEGASKTQAALGGAIPALISGLANKASTTEGAQGILDLIRQNKLDTGQYADALSAVKGPNGIASLMDIGRPLLDFVFGSKSSSMMDWVASLGGITRSSASSLLSLALPLVLGQISRRMGSSGSTAAGLAGLLAGQKTFLKDAPAGLANALGFGEANFVGTYEQERRTVAAAPVVGSYETAPVAATGGSSWWKWALPVAALLALVGFFLSRRDDTQQVRARAVDATQRVAAPVIASLGTFVERRLPTGMSLNVPANGIESRLIAFIETPNQKVDKETWFSFDRLEFETDSAQLKPSSQEQLRNIAEILRAHPNVNLKLGGYTDNVGDDAYNMRLSGDRATNTMNELVSLGVDRSRLAAEGYGENFPVADNSTEEGRQRNRRIDVRVTKM